jgi:hypothetical protein
MTVITTDLTSTDIKSHLSATCIGFISLLSRVFKVITRTLADFNRYMDAAQKVNDVQRFR